MFRQILQRGLRQISPNLAAKLTTKPRLKIYHSYQEVEVKKKKQQSHYRPGFVYAFYDPSTKPEAVRQALREKRERLAILIQGTTFCKIGLSRTPRTRRYFLSREYESELEIKAIAFTMNMKVTEDLLHYIFSAHNELRKTRNSEGKNLDGYTEWFRVTPLRLKMIQIMVYTMAVLVNLAYFVFAVSASMYLFNFLF
ncbi:GIY-YIG nuclease family protein [Microcoleus sp. B9-D4]|uniref:GIY-YIG nuclease family protein n=1 Tax=Microcoleus sp. B9-D4 TaxID=2818711 RepID=UPI002FCF6584